MATTRRAVVGGGLAAGALAASPAIVRARAAVPAARTLRAVMHGDLRSFDPVWTTAVITIYHGAMVYDTLFGMDAEMRPRPQMLSRVAVSEDRKTYRFGLREGLAFSDGSPVTAADCVASVRRWAARDGGGQHLFLRVLDTPVRDERTFEIVLREPYELLIEVLAKTSTNVCYIMRRKEAETDPNQQVTTSIGSGPFLFNQDETRHGATYVYDRNPAYRPREEAPSGTAGGKVVRLDRVVWDNMDELTPVSALQAGEIDFHEVPPLDFVPELERDPKLKVEIFTRRATSGRCASTSSIRPSTGSRRAAPCSTSSIRTRSYRRPSSTRNTSGPAGPISAAARRWRTTRRRSGLRSGRTSQKRRSSSARRASTAGRS